MRLSLPTLAILGLSLFGTAIAAAVPEAATKHEANLAPRQDDGIPGVRLLPDLPLTRPLIHLISNRNVLLVLSDATASIQTEINLIYLVEMVLAYVGY
jgi:hypothetical protein